MRGRGVAAGKTGAPGKAFIAGSASAAGGGLFVGLAGAGRGLGAAFFAAAGSIRVTGAFFFAPCSVAGTTARAAASSSVRLGEDLTIEHRPRDRQLVLNDFFVECHEATGRIGGGQATRGAGSF